MCSDGCVGCGVQVQRAWADWAVGGAGDGVGVGHVDRVQDEWWGGWEYGAGCDGGRTGRVAHGEPVIRWKHGIEREGDERGEHGGRERERERGGLRDKQVVIFCFWGFGPKWSTALAWFSSSQHDERQGLLCGCDTWHEVGGDVF